MSEISVKKSGYKSKDLEIFKTKKLIHLIFIFKILLLFKCKQICDIDQVLCAKHAVESMYSYDNRWI